ncbi:MAG: PAS domain S-box protein [Proteobacteria bacterium]|nr:PAS domain S-box protein [Pseudomonadota bacterium]
MKSFNRNNKDKEIAPTSSSSEEHIKERIRAEKALELSEKKYRNILESIEDFYFEVDLRGTFTFVNDANRRYTGYTNEEIIGMNYQDYMSRSEAERVYKFYNKVYKTGKPGRGLNYKVFRKDDTLMYVETTCTLIKDNEGNPIGFRGVSRDVTTRKQASLILEESEQRLREIIQGSSVPTFVMNDKHIITHWNKACEKLTGVKARKIIGTNEHWKAFYIEKRPAMSDLVVDRASIKTIKEYYGTNFRHSPVIKNAFEAEHFFPHLGEDGKWLFFTAAPLNDSKRNITGAIETLLDVSQRKQAEVELLKVHEALEEKVRERTRSLEEANIALRVLLKKREEDKRDLEEQMLFNIREIISPYIEKLNSSPLKERQKVYLEIIERNLNDIVSPFMRGLSDTFHKLTPSEIQVINLIKQDKTTKEIADFLFVSPRTVEFHRDNIRKKFGIKNRKINLRSYLLTLEK